MEYTVENLENLINSVLDKELTCNDLPNVCGIASSTEGRKRIVDAAKLLILEGGLTSVDAALNQIEISLSEPEFD